MSLQVVSKPLPDIVALTPLVAKPAQDKLVETKGKTLFPRLQLDPEDAAVSAFVIPSAIVSTVQAEANKVQLLFEEPWIGEDLQAFGDKLLEEIRTWYPDTKVYWTNPIAAYKRHKDCTLPIEGLAGKELRTIVVRPGVLLTPTQAKGEPLGSPLNIVFARVYYQLLGWSLAEESSPPPVAPAKSSARAEGSTTSGSGGRPARDEAQRRPSRR